MKTKVDVNGIKAAQEEIRRINKIPFEDIIWMDGDREIPVSDAVKENWRFVGMTNCSFIEYDLYENPGEFAEPDRWKGSL
jgi:hypothetical protein